MKSNFPFIYYSDLVFWTMCAPSTFRFFFFFFATVTAITIDGMKSGEVVGEVLMEYVIQYMGASIMFEQSLDC